VSKKINFTLDNSLHSLTIDQERKTYINDDKYKLVIIEIKSEDNLNTNGFFEFEEKENFPNNSHIGVVINNEKEKYLEYFIYKINNISGNGYIMEYSCNDKELNESIGNPIINMKNNKIIGIQKNSGYGLLLREPIKEFFEADIKEEKETKKLYQSLKKTFTVKSTIKIDQAKLDNEIGILYLLPKIFSFLKLRSLDLAEGIFILFLPFKNK